MKTIFILICLCLIVAFCINKANVFGKKLSGEEGESPYFSKEVSDTLKAVLPFFIIFHHTHLETGMMPDFMFVGYYVVGLFFFISGYGIHCKYNFDLSPSQLFKRYAKLLLPILLPAVLFIAILICKGEFSFSRISGYRIILPYTWFIITLAILYACYSITSVVKIRLQYIKLIVLVFAVCVSSGLIHYLGGQNTYYCSNLAFVAGVASSMFRDDITKLLESKNSSLIILAIFLIFGFISFNPNISIKFALYILIPIWSFAFTALLHVAKLRLNLMWSKYSFEIYLCQGLAFAILEKCFDSPAGIYRSILLGGGNLRVVCGSCNALSNINQKGYQMICFLVVYIENCIITYLYEL